MMMMTTMMVIIIIIIIIMVVFFCCLKKNFHVLLSSVKKMGKILRGKFRHCGLDAKLFGGTM
jgi:hypothetical protein